MGFSSGCFFPVADPVGIPFVFPVLVLGVWVGQGPWADRLRSRMKLTKQRNDLKLQLSQFLWTFQSRCMFLFRLTPIPNDPTLPCNHCFPARGCTRTSGGREKRWCVYSRWLRLRCRSNSGSPTDINWVPVFFPSQLVAAGVLGFCEAASNASRIAADPVARVAANLVLRLAADGPHANFNILVPVCIRPAVALPRASSALF